MVMRLVMVFVLVAALSGCLKKTADENAYTKPSVTQEGAVDTEVTEVSQAPEDVQGRNVTVEPAVGQASTVEKPSIQDIQQALSNAGFYKGKIDGILGPNTRKAVEAFQSQNALKADGKVGPKTWNKLKEHLIK